MLLNRCSVGNERQRMREAAGWAPGHSEEYVQRHAKPLGTVDVPQRWRVGHNAFCSERCHMPLFIWFGASRIRGVDNLRQLAPLCSDISPATIRDYASVPCNILRKDLWVASKRIELKAIADHPITEGGMSGEPNSVAILLHCSAKGKEWLNVPSCSNDEHHNGKLGGSPAPRLLSKCNIQRLRFIMAFLLLMNGIKNRFILLVLVSDTDTPIESEVECLQ
mmetsp:Transcript_1883/g.5491  ORF Transcript_1883/g.5491 Transcript_1883/m.5491 type:complete len:221 (-) Transcript_1883:534-1196(-)